MKAERFVVLDGLRGLAAVMVVWVHLATMTGIWFPGRVFSVDLFFMISGFIIPYSYEVRLRGGMTFASFFEVRVTRLYPLYILGCAIGLLAYGCRAIDLHARYPLREPLLSVPWALLVLPKPAWEPQNSFMLNPPAWTLSLEYIINFAYVLALPWLSTRVMALVATAATVALAVATLHFGTIDFGTGGIQFVWGLARVGCPFAIGALLYRLWITDLLPRLRVPALGIAALFILTVPLSVSRFEGPWLDWGMIAIGFPILTSMAIFATVQGWLAKVFHWAGELSYPLYTLHLPMFTFAAQFGHLLGMSYRSATLSAVPVIIVASALANKFYDQPARAWLRRRFHLRRPDVDAAAPL